MQAAIHKPFLLRKSILDDKKTDTDSKQLVLQTVKHNIAVLTEGMGKITLDTAQSVEPKHHKNVSGFLLSAKDVIEVKPESGTEFRITGKNRFMLSGFE